MSVPGRGRAPVLGATLAAAAVGAVLAARAPVAAQQPPAPQTSPKGYIEMPEAEDGAWVLSARTGSGRNWGTPTFVRYLVMVAREWKRRHPDGPFLRIGDMSKPDGSDFPPHKTHKDGLTADIFTSPRNICHVDWEDQALTLELARLMHDLGARQILYNGALVIEQVPVAQKWPQHDDHFHIVIDPARVPSEGEVLVVPGPGLRDGAVVGAPRLAADRTGLELAWQLVGQTKLEHWRVLVEGQDGAPVFDSGPRRDARMRVELPVALEHGRRYRWKVELSRGGELPALGFGWQGFTTDLVAPEVEATAPADEEAVAAPPTLAWRWAKTGAAQARFRIELDGDANHRKIAGTLGPFEGAAARYVLAVPLKRGKKYWWRVVAEDAHGNEGASAWRAFKVDRQAGGGADEEQAPTGTVNAASLNLRAGPGADHPVVTSLPKGTLVTIRGAPNADWLEVEAPGPDGKPARGFVAKRYIDRE